MRKKVDQRIRTLVENGVKLHQRSMFVIVGDRGRDQARPTPRLRAARCAACAARARVSRGGRVASAGRAAARCGAGRASAGRMR